MPQWRKPSGTLADPHSSPSRSVHMGLGCHVPLSSGDPVVLPKHVLPVRKLPATCSMGRVPPPPPPPPPTSAAQVVHREGLMGLDTECYKLTPRKMSWRDTRTTGIRQDCGGGAKWEGGENGGAKVVPAATNVQSAIWAKSMWLERCIQAYDKGRDQSGGRVCVANCSPGYLRDRRAN